MRPIDADALKRKFIEWLPRDGEEWVSDIHPVEDIAVSALMEIDDTPTLDVVEVVRCKDCKWLRIDKEFAAGRYCAIRNVNGGGYFIADDIGKVLFFDEGEAALRSCKK